MSETAAARDRLKKYIVGEYILDAGFGGSSCLPGKAITLDMPTPYCPSLEGHKQILRGDYRQMPFINDDAFDTIWASHAIEDWTIEEQIVIVNEWKRCLACYGHLIILAPDEQIYRKHCAETGQIYNKNHKLEFYSLEMFKSEVLPQTGAWEILFETSLVDGYSWNIVLKKLP